MNAEAGPSRPRPRTGSPVSKVASVPETFTSNHSGNLCGNAFSTLLARSGPKSPAVVVEGRAFALVVVTLACPFTFAVSQLLALYGITRSIYYLLFLQPIEPPPKTALPELLKSRRRLRSPPPVLAALKVEPEPAAEQPEKPLRTPSRASSATLVDSDSPPLSPQSDDASEATASVAGSTVAAGKRKRSWTKAKVCPAKALQAASALSAKAIESPSPASEASPILARSVRSMSPKSLSSEETAPAPSSNGIRELFRPRRVKSIPPPAPSPPLKTPRIKMARTGSAGILDGSGDSALELGHFMLRERA